MLDLEAFYPAEGALRAGDAAEQPAGLAGLRDWLEGEPLDIGGMLYTPDGKPRVAIISIAHLDDAERMFFVTMLLNEVLSWMRAQPGTRACGRSSTWTRSFGYFPPVANPPSKRPMLRC